MKINTENSKQGVAGHYLTVVPAIPNTLEDPTYGSDDAEDACNPVTAIEDTDRLNYARGSGTEADYSR